MKLHPTKKKYLDHGTGYWMVFLEDGTRTCYHRWKMEKHLGHQLGKDQVVHHKDGNKINNLLSNLEVISRKSHAELHAKDTPPAAIVEKECLRCRLKVKAKASLIRYREKLGHDFYCSHKCSTQAQMERQYGRRDKDEDKKCLGCGHFFPKKTNVSSKKWREAKFCSLKCRKGTPRRQIR